MQNCVCENAVKFLSVRGEGKSVSVCCQMAMLSLFFLVAYKLLRNPFSWKGLMIVK